LFIHVNRLAVVYCTLPVPYRTCPVTGDITAALSRFLSAELSSPSQPTAAVPAGSPRVHGTTLLTVGVPAGSPHPLHATAKSASLAARTWRNEEVEQGIKGDQKKKKRKKWMCLNPKSNKGCGRPVADIGKATREGLGDY
jgi:hypothetical protein